MPVVRISALPQPDGVDVEGALRAVTRELAALEGGPAQHYWATWDEIPPGRYAEGDEAPALQPPGTHPPLVRLLAFEGRSEERVAALLTTVADVLARELRLEPGNVFVLHEEGRSGRVYDGGEIVRRG